MPAPYLGKIKFHWCTSCNIPLLGDKCDLCSNVGQFFNVTPPGDLRPSFSANKMRIKQTLLKMYGNPCISLFNHLVRGGLLLNKVPYEDRMDEIISFGRVYGLFRYNLIRQKFEFFPRINSAIILVESGLLRKIVVIDDGAVPYISKGASVLIPGVVEIDPSIEKEEPVIVVNRNRSVIACGIAKMSAINAEKATRGVLVKTKYYKNRNYDYKELDTKKEVTFNRIVEANRSFLIKEEKEAMQFIKRTADHYSPPALVAYSGGKDSLAVLSLVSKVLPDYHIMFADTGLEFPETIENVNKTACYFLHNRFQTSYKERKANQKEFWDFFSIHGPPGRDARYCSKKSKLLPINQIMEEEYPNKNKILTFSGIRKYESYSRSKEPRISKNPWIPKQTSAFPIHKWSALHVFLYIHYSGHEEYINPLYTNVGLTRVGCWLCPATNMGDFQLILESHPQHYNKLLGALREWKEQHQLPDDWIKYGLWRWNNLPQKMIKLLDLKTVEAKEKSTSAVIENMDKF